MDIVRVKSMIVEVDNGCYSQEIEVAVEDMIGIVKGYMKSPLDYNDTFSIKGKDDLALELYRMINKGKF